MTETPSHPTEALQAAADDRLDAGSRTAVESHLATCERCRRELAAIRWTKARLAAAAAVEVPADLDMRLRSALDAEDDRAGQAPLPAAEPTRRQWWWGAAAAAALIAAVWAGFSGRSGPAPADAAATFTAFAEGQLALDVSSAEPAAVESYLRDGGLGFPVRVFDFAMMEYSLAGGALHRLGGRTSALMAYRGAGDRRVICQMYLGRTDELPDPAERRIHNDIEFLIHREDGLTLVFWQEGEVVCVLVANGDEENAIQLAFAKAVKI